ncbi:MAG: MBL fold metallo-hydrolase [Betaproteobacteria bacterium]|nr:MBL fold metallo-hydrolase [Betaproteobacteria bacterium]
MDYVTDYGEGIFAIDSGFGRPLLDAVHLIVEGERAALIDTATNSCAPRLMEVLGTLGLHPEQIDYIILTHIHLDHAGAAGKLMQLLPQAKLVVHPRGARHMIDPGKLLAGTIAVYGSAATQRMYGELLPVPRERIIEAQHEQTISLNGRELLLLDTPGHARHHIGIRDARTGHIFSGDTFGMCYRELDRDGRRFVFPTTTPVQFDPPALHRSITMLTEYRPAAIYVTHFSQVTEVPRLAADLHRLIDAHAELGMRERNSGAARHERLMAGITAILLEEAAQQGWALQGETMLRFMKMDVELNAQGLGAWLDASS